MSLPPSAQAKLIAFEGSATDAREAAMSAQRGINGLQKSLAVTDDETTLAGTEMEIARLRSVQGQQNLRHRVLAELSVNLQRWLQQHRDASFELARATRVAPHDGETIAEAVNRIRDELLAAQQHLRVVRTAPLPKRDLKAKAREYVRQLTERGRPRLKIKDGELGFDFMVTKLAHPTSFEPPVTSKDIAALMAWCDPDTMTKKLCAEIDAAPDAAAAMSTTEKETRTAELTETIANLERQEEALVTAAIEQGTEILRRADASPLAVLGIQIKKRVAEAA